MRAGDLVDHFSILAPLGAGGMGEVFRATDTRLEREVAIKVLPAALAGDPERLRRFAQEARLVGQLNHPNILALYDIGTYAEAPYLVTELLDGETLCDRLKAGALAPRKAIQLAVGIANGLAAAHAKGIVHRDLKPGNVLVTTDGVVKILDFGLAKLTHPSTETPTEATAATARADTVAGLVIGTAGYMAPEQIRGLPVDHRADIFAYGCVLYEMLSGQRAFAGETPADVMSAILTNEAPPLPAGIPPQLDRIVRHCLEKQPEDRFASARDIAFDLEALSGVSGPPAVPNLSFHVRRGTRPWAPVLRQAAGLFLLAATSLAAFFLGHWLARPPKAEFQRLTFRRGTITAARFTPDGQSVVYSAGWEGQPSEVFSVRLDDGGSSPLGIPRADLLAISTSGELALSLSHRNDRPVGPSMLAVAPLSGGPPRPIDESVLFAEWAKGRSEMMLVREASQYTQLEYPPPQVIYRAVGSIVNARVSPDGELVAFLEGDPLAGVPASVNVVDRTGHKRVLAGPFVTARGLAWSPDGNEVWFTAGRTDPRMQLRAVTLGGRERTVFSQPRSMVLHDVAPDGRVLLDNIEIRGRVFFRGEGDTVDRELSCLGYSVLGDISRDGRYVVLGEAAGNAAGTGWLYLRRTSGAPAVKMGVAYGVAAGYWGRFSPDSRFVVAPRVNPGAIVLYPIGPGQPRTVAVPGFTMYSAGLSPDGETIWFAGAEPSRPARIWVTDLAGTKPRPVTPEGVVGRVSPDGQYVEGLSDGERRLFPLAGLQPLSLGALGDRRWFIVGWAQAAQSLYVAFLEGIPMLDIPVKVFRVELATGRRDLVREIIPEDRAGLQGIVPLMAPDGKSCAYQVTQTLSELYSVAGLQ